MALGTSNITTTLVKNTLGASTNKVSELCTHANINMWAKRKPVQDSRKIIPEDEVGVGNDGNYGLSIPIWVRDTNQNWTYIRPTSNFRLGDFRGYLHSAVNPIRITTDLNGESVNLAESETVTFSFIKTSYPDYHNIALEDLAQLSGYYLGVELENDSGEIIWGTSSNFNSITLDFGDIYSPLSNPQWRTGNIIARFFFVNAQKNFGDEEPPQSPSRLAIHYETGRPTTQTFSVIKTATVEAEITGVREDLTTGFWVTPATYLEPDYSNVPPVPTEDFIACRVRFRSLTDANINLGGDKFYYNVSKTHITSDGYSKDFGNSSATSIMYDINGNQVLDIVAPSGSWSDEYILYFSMMNRDSNGDIVSVPPNLETITRVRIFQKNLPGYSDFSLDSGYIKATT